MDNKIDYRSLASYSLNLAEQNSANVKCAEVYFEKSKYLTLEVEENSIKNSEMGSDEGISIRVIDNRGSLGFAFTNTVKKASIEKMVNTAVKMMKAGTKDLDFRDLPSSYQNYPNVKGLFDKNLKELQIEDSTAYIEDIIRVCMDDDQAISQSAIFKSAYSKTMILNSNGLEVQDKDTNCMVYSQIIVEDKFSKDKSSGSEWESQRNLKDINVLKIAEKALEKAKSNLNRKKIKNMKCPLILTPNGAIDLILQSISMAINAETYQYKRGFLVGKLDTIIGSNNLTIEDNALIDGAAGSSSFDGEGVPCQNRTIIENGKLLKSGLLHNSYTANKEGTESTGNASRSSYSSIPYIGSSNFILKPGNVSKEEIIKDVKRGILMDYTGDSPNFATGDFSGLILQGNLIENGEIKHPLNETMIAINLLDLFTKIDAISKEFEIYGSFQAPYVRIGEVQILGGSNAMS
ncbi:MAG: TldD/PmbA family protein [Promethearchaeota archaeon]